MSRKKASSDSRKRGARPPRKLQLSPEVDAGAVLGDVVRAAGGRAGFLATWDVAHPERAPRTSSYNLDNDTASAVSALFRELPGLEGRQVDDQLLEEVRKASVRAGLGELEVLALPVRSHDRSVGFMCLLHPSHAASLLKRTPGVYNIRLDEVGAVVQNARLLERLLAERKWLEAIVAHSANGIAVIDADARVVGFNPAMARLSGRSLDEAVGHPVHEVFPLRFVHEISETGLALADRGPRLPVGDHAVDAQLRNQDGEWIDVEAATTTLWDEGNRVLGWALNVRDIRPRKEKERLERIFLSGVSHELQTPIAVIKGFSGLLSDPDVALTPEQRREKAAIINEESRRLERMVGQLLYATRIQAGGVQLVMEQVALGDLLIRTAGRLETLAHDRGCTLEVEVPHDVPLVRADPEKVEQVLTNFIENAIKYSNDGCVVQISLHVRPEDVEISVADRGPGVSQGDRERIFHAFERGTGGTRASGSGLGLFISKSIVEAHRGRIGVEDNREAGSRFYFTLPRSQ